MSDDIIEFSGHGPFDEEERALIVEVVAAVAEAGEKEMVREIQHQVHQLDRLGELLGSYPSLLATQRLGGQQRDSDSLVKMLCRSNLSNFDMFLPTRALLSRDLVMGEVNFYRLLRVVCRLALSEAQKSAVGPRVDRILSRCLYTRLAEEVLKHIASDSKVRFEVRERAVLALTQIWEQATYCISDFFPVLEATWEARRHVPVTLGTLMGASEMFQLVQAGCDEKFVDFLVRPDHGPGEAAAFREFLFGSTTEMLHSIGERMIDSGKRVIGRDDLDEHERPRDATLGDDPALAMFEFFLSRHLQAAARRQANLPGPKRTAEEYVMLHFLQQTMDEKKLSIPPPP
jgi:hypothetical protein